MFIIVASNIISSLGQRRGPHDGQRAEVDVEVVGAYGRSQYNVAYDSIL